MSEFNWRLRAACREYDSNIWFEPAWAQAAKSVCQVCPVLDQCGATVGLGERFGVRAGHDLSNAAERKALHKLHGRVQQAEQAQAPKRCRRCGQAFEPQFNGCVQCQDMVDIGPVREHINALRDAGMTLPVIAAAAGISGPSVKHMVYGKSERGTVYTVRDKAERVLAIPVLKAVS